MVRKGQAGSKTQGGALATRSDGHSGQSQAAAHGGRSRLTASQGSPGPPSNHDPRDTGLPGTRTPAWTAMNVGFQPWTWTHPGSDSSATDKWQRLWDKLRDGSLSVLTCKVG